MRRSPGGIPSTLAGLGLPALGVLCMSLHVFSGVSVGPSPSKGPCGLQSPLFTPSHLPQHVLPQELYLLCDADCGGTIDCEEVAPTLNGVAIRLAHIVNVRGVL